MTNKGTTLKTECCMCGDLGFSDQLFLCKICQFRSQHRYCSNLYPRTDFSGTCNWCLSQEDSPNSSNSSSSYKNNGSTEDEGKNKKIKNCIMKKGLIKESGGGGGGGCGGYHLQLPKPMKKPKSPSEAKSPLSSTSPPVIVSTRKRIITNGALEEKLRRTRSEGVIKSSNSVGATKHVFRNKVRRYKLLEEVSS
ncbi:unnamed protein product [Lathyrus oleraceus]|uniref:PHD-type zinc finger plants domain-containing protein n=1 Tax=Pisum sativum TaxID=3888 RepID=A0A9D4YE71_PEA|nr:uncharacterized protein LOC127118691 [Pisum sativum]KAI5435570.1 hypothetical protein KIW84_022113 [Pisum sativum]